MEKQSSFSNILQERRKCLINEKQNIKKEAFDGIFPKKEKKKILL